MQELEELQEQETKKISADLLKTRVESLDVEAKSKRWNRTQMLDFILEERYENPAIETPKLKYNAHDELMMELNKGNRSEY
ncbi:hypothetical protein [Alkalihalobacillus sp. R86527]|uniref:hypothetical protein n=1 Tax=Alkalihalobacillus sp. R86527 TaxID=3093863 RepID=UPI00366FD6A5